MTPEELQPLIDALGDINILESLMLFGGIEGVATNKGSRAKAKNAAEHGIHYSGAHWYARLVDDSSADSYSSHYQIDGTAHFCQTFAVMIYTGKTGNLKANDYAGNVEAAMNFLLEYIDDIKKDKDQTNWLDRALREVNLTLTTFRKKIEQARASSDIVCKYK